MSEVYVRGVLSPLLPTIATYAEVIAQNKARILFNNDKEKYKGSIFSYNHNKGVVSWQGRWTCG